MSYAEDQKTESPVFESYPTPLILVAVGLSLSIYALGSLILARMGSGYLLVYLLFLVYLETNLLRKSCVNCAYYGKACFSGRGWIAARLFKRGDPSRFASREITWLAILPDLLVTLSPLAVGLFLLIRGFAWTVVVLMMGLVILAFPANGFVRGKLACCHCRQQKLGCPAEKLFRKRQSTGMPPA